MRNYSKVGGKKGKPGYRTPRSFLSKCIQITRKFSNKQFYTKTKKRLMKKFEKINKNHFRNK